MYVPISTGSDSPSDKRVERRVEINRLSYLMALQAPTDHQGGSGHILAIHGNGTVSSVTEILPNITFLALCLVTSCRVSKDCEGKHRLGVYSGLADFAESRYNTAEIPQLIFTTEQKEEMYLCADMNMQLRARSRRELEKMSCDEKRRCYWKEDGLSPKKEDKTKGNGNVTEEAVSRSARFMHHTLCGKPGEVTKCLKRKEQKRWFLKIDNSGRVQIKRLKNRLGRKRKNKGRIRVSRDKVKKWKAERKMLTFTKLLRQDSNTRHRGSRNKRRRGNRGPVHV